MKKMTLCLMLILTLIFPGVVIATDTSIDNITLDSSIQEIVAKIGEEEYTTLEEAVEVANNITEATITLQKDAVLKNSIDITGNITLNLNGFNICPDANISTVDGKYTHNALIFVLSGGNLTVKDETGKGKIYVGDNEKLYSAIQVTKKGEHDETKTAKLVVNGGTLEGYYYGISGNGSRHNTEIIINGGNIKSVASDGVAIFHPQVGILTVNGGTIESVSGIEMRAGELEVNGGTIIGNGKSLTVTPNGSGNTTYGVGIAIAQHNDGLPVEGIINGGKIQGISAVYQSDPQKNTQKENGEEFINNVSILIFDGYFEAINGGKESVYSENKACFISGGTFNSEIDKIYLAGEATAEKDSNGNYVVGTRYNVVIKETTNGTVTTSVQKALEGEKVKLTVTEALDYELSSLIVLNADNNKIEVNENREFIMPAGGVTVIAEFAKIIPPMDYIITGNETENSNIGVVESEKVIETLDKSLEADKELNQKVEEERQKGNQVTVEITMEELDEKSVKDEEKQKILQNIAKNQTVHQYFDISILVRTSEKELGKLTELTEEMTFSMEIPEELIQEGRTFYIINLHGDEVKIIDATLNGTKLKFVTSHFSTFALAYEDEKTIDDGVTENDGSQEMPGGAIQEPTEEPKEEVKEEQQNENKEEAKEEVNVPNTGDNIVLYVLLAIVALVGIILLKKVNSKNNKN